MSRTILPQARTEFFREATLYKKTAGRTRGFPDRETVSAASADLMHDSTCKTISQTGSNLATIAPRKAKRGKGSLNATAIFSPSDAHDLKVQMTGSLRPDLPE
jgi:hypothetical protein